MTFFFLYSRLKPNLHFIHWNQEGWKTGLCSVPPVGHPYSLLTLANNTCVRHSFKDLRDRFTRLYKRKVCSSIKFKSLYCSRSLRKIYFGNLELVYGNVILFLSSNNNMQQKNLLCLTIVWQPLTRNNTPKCCISYWVFWS